MRRFLLVPLVAVLAVTAAPAKRVAAPPSPVQRALAAEVVVVGKVTAIEKDAVEAPPAPGAPNKVAYKVAVVKVEAGLAGADNLTHVKVGFVPAADPAGGRPRGFGPVALTAGQEGLFFLTRHPSGQFYTFNWMAPPVDAKAETYPAQVDGVKKALAAVADPARALKADKAEDRAFAAVAIVTKYRTAPAGGGEAGSEKVPAAESRAILQALAAADWTKFTPDAPPPVTAFYMLGLTDANGWVAPKPGPGGNYTAALQKAFARWVDGPGKDYQITKLVPKKK